MEYRTLGKTGLRVSALGFGCGNVGGLIIREEPRTRVRAVARAIEAGINYFDTASMYGNGQSEQNLGQVLNELKPDVYVGTKVRIRPDEMGDMRGAIQRSVEASLTRMAREQVDLIQLHTTSYSAGRLAVRENRHSLPKRCWKTSSPPFGSSRLTAKCAFTASRVWATRRRSSRSSTRPYCTRCRCSITCSIPALAILYPRASRARIFAY